MTGRPIPDGVLTLAMEVTGRVTRVTPLGGMSGASVSRLAGPDGTVVAKWTAAPREAAVYRTSSGDLAAAGVRIPVCHGVVSVADGAWLLLEDIPAMLPRERWLADPEVMATLARLHRVPPAAFATAGELFRPTWDPPMTDLAVSWLGEASRHPMAVVRAEWVALAAPAGTISGDPNPLNWGVAADGEVVLMDWERLGVGHPAIDVAITVPGLGSPKDFARAAAVYNAAAGRDVVDARQLALAKAWTAIELLAAAGPLVADHGTGPVPGSRLRGMAGSLADAFPAWLGRLASG